MHLFVIRHGEAESANSNGDFSRRLSDQGRNAIISSGFGLARMGLRFNHILHSPLVRARETADILADLSDSTPLETNGLAAPPDLSLLSELKSLEGRVAVIGHLPWVAELVSWLTLSKVNNADSFIFSPGTIAALHGDPEPGAMCLYGFWQPGSFG